jgi:hypothetical protein
VILCDVLQNGSIMPRFVLLSGSPISSVLSKFEDICGKGIRQEIVPLSNDIDLVMAESILELAVTLTSVTLIACGLGSVAIFAGLVNLEILSLPWNDIESLRHWPLR